MQKRGIPNPTCIVVLKHSSSCLPRPDHLSKAILQDTDSFTGKLESARADVEVEPGELIPKFFMYLKLGLQFILS